MSESNEYRGLSPLEARADLALELANTVREPRARDELDSPAALGRWVEATGLGEADEGVLLRVPEFRAVRTAVRELFAAASADEPLPRAAVEAVNSASASVPSFPRLDVADPRAPVAVEETTAASPTTRMLAAVARSAIAVVAHERPIRRCSAPRCGRYFVAGRAGRVWCSAACGNRARVARHHVRRRSAPLPQPAYERRSPPA